DAKEDCENQELIHPECASGPFGGGWSCQTGSCAFRCAPSAPGTLGGSCGGFADIRCSGVFLYCFHEVESACGAGDRTRVCRPRADLCPEVIQPVCGCDGNTFNNSCEASRAGISVSSSGPCAHN